MAVSSDEQADALGAYPACEFTQSTNQPTDNQGTRYGRVALLAVISDIQVLGNRPFEAT
jgi:hypothetical protein